MRGPILVTATELDRWATTAHAKVVLPDLIRRLVKATVPSEQLLKVDFPAYAETHRPGYDGTTVTNQQTDYVPDGVAVWELGCEKNCKAKAQKDYDKRIEEHLQRTQADAGDDLGEATFIALTPRDWHAATAGKGKRSKATAKKSKTRISKAGSSLPSGSMADWAKQRSADGPFHAVRAYDSSRLEQWLQEAQAVAIWFSTDQLGKPIPGVLDVSSYWSNVSHTFARPLPPDLFLTNRLGTANEFKEWLDGPPRQLLIKAPSAWEVAAVFSAWVHTLPEPERENILARAVMVDSRDEWRVLSDSPPHKPLILVAAEPLAAEAPELFAAAERNGHHVLRFAEFRVPANAGAIPMERIRQHDLEQALVKAGIDESEAAKLASASGGNLTILRRRFPHAGYTSPAWARDARLAPLVLIGAWGDQVAGDKEIVEQITAQPYEFSRIAVAHWLAENDSPVRLILNAWEFLSLPDAWEMLCHFLSPEHTATFAKASMSVLSEDDPGLSLPPDDRPMASFKGKKRRYSSALRQGICEILALGASREDENDAQPGGGIAAHAGAIVREVLSESCGWKRWASLGSLLALLAEAAPAEFLKAVERDLRTPAPQLIELFRQELPPSALGGGVYHSGLLWALETLAWSKEHMPRAAFLLARLAELDPGGKWANRPQGSVGRIFFSWRPQTVAPVGERLTVLRDLCRRIPQVGWKIVLGLIPELHQAFMDSSKPSYRDWSAGWEGNIAGEDYRTCIDTIIDLAIGLAAKEPQRWAELIDRMGPLFFYAPTEYLKLREALSSLIDAGTHSEVRDHLWEHLRKFVEDHTNYRDAHWALPADEIDHLAEIRDALQPEDLVTGSVHWFDDGRLIDGDTALTYEQKIERQAEKRRQVVTAIWSAEGLDGVLRLARKVRLAGTVGWAVGEAVGAAVQSDILPSLLNCGDDALESFSCVYARQRVHAQGYSWATSVPEANWTSSQLAVWALQMPFGPDTWDWVASRNVEAERLYWESAGTWGGAELDLPAGRRAAQQFQKVGRPWAALDYLMSRQHVKRDVAGAIIVEALEAIASDPGNSKLGTMDSHHVHEAFKFLHDSVDQDDVRLARLEYSFLPFLDRFSPVSPKTLERQLGADPTLFIDCLKTVFRPRGEAKDTVSEEAEESLPHNVTEEGQAQRARVIFGLLHNWKTIPGSDENGVVSLEKLRSWITSVRELARTADRIEVCDITIGDLFGKSSHDSDGGLPLVAIREVIEEVASEELERGLYTGLLNRRGVVTKELYEGGKKERDLAGTYQTYAQICARWPRTAAVLTDIAKSYRHKAKFEDERAEARK